MSSTMNCSWCLGKTDKHYSNWIPSATGEKSNYTTLCYDCSNQFNEYQNIKFDNKHPMEALQQLYEIREQIREQRRKKI